MTLLPPIRWTLIGERRSLNGLHFIGQEMKSWHVAPTLKRHLPVPSQVEVLEETCLGAGRYSTTVKDLCGGNYGLGTAFRKRRAQSMARPKKIAQGSMDSDCNISGAGCKRIFGLLCQSIAVIYRGLADL